MCTGFPLYTGLQIAAVHLEEGHLHLSQPHVLGNMLQDSFGYSAPNSLYMYVCMYVC